MPIGNFASPYIFGVFKVFFLKELGRCREEELDE